MQRRIFSNTILPFWNYSSLKHPSEFWQHLKNNLVRNSTRRNLKKQHQYNCTRETGECKNKQAKSTTTRNKTNSMYFESALYFLFLHCCPNLPQSYTIGSEKKYKKFNDISHGDRDQAQV